MTIATIPVLALAALIGIAPVAPAQTYSTLDFPGTISTEPSGINDAGEIVGTYVDGTGATHGFRFANGSFTVIDFPGAMRTAAVSVNYYADVAGFFLDASNQWHGFVLSNGEWFVQDYPTATTGSFSLGISDRGTLVGEFKIGQAFGQLGYASIMRYGTYSQLRPPGAVQAFATSVNAQGDVVGRLINSTGAQRAWRFNQNGGYTVFSYPGAALTNARNINAHGEVVGVYLLNGVNHGFLLPNNDFTNFTTIDFPGAASTRALGINTRGDIVGTYDLAGMRHGFFRASANDVKEERGKGEKVQE